MLGVDNLDQNDKADFDSNKRSCFINKSEFNVDQELDINMTK